MCIVSLLFICQVWFMFWGFYVLIAADSIRWSISGMRMDHNMLRVRLCEAWFDEESIKRRDNGSLIAHIAKLEAQVVILFHVVDNCMVLLIGFSC